MSEDFDAEFTSQGIKVNRNCRQVITVNTAGTDGKLLVSLNKCLLEALCCCILTDDVKFINDELKFIFLSRSCHSLISLGRGADSRGKIVKILLRKRHK